MKVLVRSHSHKHDKVKCAICVAKAQKNPLKKKDPHHEESKKITSLKSISESTKFEKILEKKDYNSQSFFKKIILTIHATFLILQFRRSLT